MKRFLIFTSATLAIASGPACGSDSNNGPPSATDAGVDAESPAQATITWKACPVYSDDVIRAQNVSDDRIAAYRAILNRLECGTLNAPLNYDHPAGRAVTIAVTRLAATDRTHRLGSIAVNPGGPGASGYLMPVKVTFFNSESAHLNERYDLIGFDPRGVNYSTKLSCQQGQGQRPDGGGPAGGPSGGPEGGPPDADAGAPPMPDAPAGPLTEEAATQIYDNGLAANEACVKLDPELAGQLNSLNIARDLDRVRIALGEQTLSYLGVSWGTRLGAAYVTAFPGKTGRVFLDSVLPPSFRIAALEDAQAASAERHFERMATWIAAHHETYGLGDTPEEVSAGVLALVNAYDANPKRYSDLGIPVDGALIATLASQTALDWSVSSQALKELQSSTGTTAPPALKQLLGGNHAQVAGALEAQSSTARLAVNCNDDPTRTDFSTAWNAYQRRLVQNRVTGRGARFLSDNCAGWPLPAQELSLQGTDGSLVLSGHRYEVITPYEWTTQLQSAMGGTLFTVDDDEHGSVLKVPECAAKLVTYFLTGQIDSGCAGFASP